MAGPKAPQRPLAVVCGRRACRNVTDPSAAGEHLFRLRCLCSPCQCRRGAPAYNPPTELRRWRIRVSIELSKFEEAVNSALADGNPCLLATADASGQPDIAFKGSMMIFDGEH